MSLYYPTGNCTPGGSIPDYNCDPCATYEFGRIRSVAFIKNDFTFSDPSDPTEWATGIAAKDIIVIWQTQGSYDGGATAELVGFGDLATVNGNTTHTLTFKDVNYSENCDFYNAIKKSNDYSLAFRTSSQVHLSGTSVTVTPKNPITDDINSVVTWEVQCKWTNPDAPCPYDTPAGIFDTCYIVA